MTKPIATRASFAELLENVNQGRLWYFQKLGDLDWSSQSCPKSNLIAEEKLTRIKEALSGFQERVQKQKSSMYNATYDKTYLRTEEIKAIMEALK